MSSSRILRFLTIILTLHPCYSVDECSPGTTSFKIELMTDQIPQETSWDVEDLGNEMVIEKYGPYNATTEENMLFNYSFCFNSDGCYKFTIRDLYGGFNEYYKLYYDAKLIKEGGYFNKKSTQRFGNCPTSPPSKSPTRGPSTMSPTSAISPTVAPTVAPTIASIPQTKRVKGYVLVAYIGGGFGLVLILSAMIYYFLFRKVKSGRKSTKIRPPSVVSIS